MPSSSHSSPISSSLIDLFVIFCYFTINWKRPRYRKIIRRYENIQFNIWTITEDPDDIERAIGEVFQYEKASLDRFYDMGNYSLLNTFMEMCVGRNIYSDSMTVFFRCKTIGLSEIRKNKLKKILK